MSERSPRRNWLWMLLQTPCRLFCNFYFRLKVRGQRHVPGAGSVLLISNHQSYLDPVLVSAPLQRPVSFLARHGLFDNPFFGWLIRKLGAFPIRQGAGDVKAVREVVNRLQEGHIVNMYPEGKRTDDGAIEPIQSGIALIVRRARVPVVPVVIHGAFEAWPKWRKFFRRGNIRVAYGPAMQLHELRPEQIVQTIETTFRSMLEQLHQDAEEAR